ncbi:MAG: hypothetical protein V2I57_04085 [Xanthomonadales bacterium]|nr:hypothetical protein [Xanthomonadales bacterium]
MDKERIQELVQAGVDGELDAEGRQRLAALLDESAEARALHEDLERLKAFIDRAPELPVPDSLHDAIVRGVTLPSPPAWKRWLRFSELPGFVRYGMAGAAAMVLTVVVYQAGEQLDPAQGYDDLVGTIAASGPDARKVDEVKFGSADARGEARLLAKPEGYALAVDLDLAAPTELAITLPGEAYRFNAFAQGADSLSAVSWSGNRLTATADGKQRFVVLLSESTGDPSPGEITLSLSRNGTVLLAGALDPSTARD